jgi:hypothetical protein
VRPFSLGIILTNFFVTFGQHEHEVMYIFIVQPLSRTQCSYRFTKRVKLLGLDVGPKTEIPATEFLLPVMT